MHGNLRAREENLQKIFSDSYVFRVPVYQRPYAWTRQQVGELLDDLTTARERDPGLPYFLGSIVLIKQDDKSKSHIVDGQQRLTTLTILLCLFKEFASDKKTKRELDDFIREEGSSLRGTKDRYRLGLGKRDRKFFRTHVQEPGALRKFLRDERSLKSDSRELLRLNAQHLHSALDKMPPDERHELQDFVVKQCYLVVVTTADLDSAYRIFSVMNDRGLSLSPTDILKATVIGAIGQDQQEVYGERWENLEDRLGREKFRELFAHIRMIKRRTKLSRTLQASFQDHVLTEHTADGFVDNELEPFSEVYEVIDRASYQGHPDATRINAYLEHLGRLDNSDWIPPAMLFFRRERRSPEAILNFTRKLERLAYGLFVVRANINERIRRYAEVLAAIESGGDNLWSSDGPLLLTRTEQGDVVRALEGARYSRYSRVIRPLLLRLDAALADGGARYDHKVISIEHVLPQNPARESAWLRDFTEEEREEWTDRLANLVLLSHRKNSRASNLDFLQKKKEYFTRSGVTPFALTTQVLTEKEWTPALLEKRQAELVGELRREWSLGAC